jgi:superfamily II DNA helicase RecQ
MLLFSFDDLYATQEQTPDCKIVPTLIYSTTRNLTETVLDVVNRARNPIKTNNAAFSTFAQRYHSQTGKFDKPDIVNSFASGVFPVVSATMALGLGQNWKRVWCVIHMGRGDPAAICQMLGHCGRDGQPGLGMIFVEPTRKNGKNSISKLNTNVEFQNNDDRMDALAVTPVFL